jgi:hypothetical protein
MPPQQHAIKAVHANNNGKKYRHQQRQKQCANPGFHAPSLLANF